MVLWWRKILLIYLKRWLLDEVNGIVISFDDTQNLLLSAHYVPKPGDYKNEDVLFALTKLNSIFWALTMCWLFTHSDTYNVPGTVLGPKT